MRIDVLTLFPEVFTPLQTSIPQRARQAGIWDLHLHQLRAWGVGKHKQVDDTPYGGGPGMVMACGPLLQALGEIQAQAEPRAHVVYMTPQGKPLTQARVNELALLPRILVLCGHYEGIDERVIELEVDEELCVGDFVVSGGELPAMMLIDALVRLLPGALREASVQQDSFYRGLLDHPHYTRPPEIRGLQVPSVLMSGNHAEIERWRHATAVSRTQYRRPDLYARWLADEEGTRPSGKPRKVSEGSVPPPIRSGQETTNKGVPNGQEIHESRAGAEEEGPS